MGTQETNTQKNVFTKTLLKKMDLVNDIDKLFYDLENIEEQSTIFRAILRTQNPTYLKLIKQFIINKDYLKWNNQLMNIILETHL